jgi:hypothetical protein
MSETLPRSAEHSDRRRGLLDAADPLGELLGGEEGVLMEILSAIPYAAPARLC